jgi:LDH2 family malate/lactate/ureidoglycolate dehydrogenase
MEALTMPTISMTNLIDFAARLLVRRGVPLHDAEYIANVAVTAEAMGITTHGLVQLNAVAGGIGNSIDPAKQPRIVKDKGASALIDGDGAIGQIAMRLATELAVAKAKEHGVAFIGVGNTSWIAALSVYLIPLAKQGLLAQVWCQSSQCQDCAPIGGIDPRLSTNPIALAFPTGGDPVVADFSTAAVSMGATSRMARSGQKAKHPIFMNSEGRITTDPAAMVDAKGTRGGGSILFWGGESEGHKGYAMSLWCEAMTAMSGGRTNDPKAPSRQSFSLMVLDPESFAGREYFEGQIQHLISWLRSSRLRPGHDRIRLPGQRGQESLRRAEKEGVPVDEKVLAGLNALAGKYEIAGVTTG